MRSTERRSPKFSPGLLKLEVQMKFHLSRAVVATGLGASLWLASVSSFAAPQQSKDQGQTKDQTTSQQTQSTTSSTTDKSQAAKSQTAQPQPAKKGGPLSAN